MQFAKPDGTAWRGVRTETTFLLTANRTFTRLSTSDDPRGKASRNASGDTSDDPRDKASRNASGNTSDDPRGRASRNASGDMNDGPRTVDDEM
jgi:hypothetical protein